MERQRDRETEGRRDGEIESYHLSVPPSLHPSVSPSLPLMIVAGEASGDKHGANLVKALRALRPDLRFEFFGAGGDEMRQAGVETLVDAREMAIMGALEVAMAMPKFLLAFHRLSRAANKRRPRLVILMACPDLNLRLAKGLNAKGNG